MKRIQKQLVKVTIGSMLLASPFSGVTVWAAGASDQNTLQLQQNSASIQFNGQVSTAAQPVTYAKGANYIPLSTISKLYGFSVSYDADTKESVVTKGDLEIRFAANTTQYKVNGKVQTASGELFTQQGSMMVPLRTWSEITGSRFVVSGNSYVLSWNKENTEPEVKTPPVAQFTTDKTEYKMGEPIQYINESHDEHGTIVKTEWTGKERAFFRPGFVKVTLNVTNNHGLTSSFTKEIRITEEKLHSEEEFNLLYTPAGEKYVIDGTRVLRMESVPYQIESQPMKLIRSNSPEYFLEEGIAYQDNVSGKFRVNIHNGNRSGKALTVYLVATNHQDHPVTYSVDAFGKGGPTTYVSTSGKNAVARFLDDLAHGSPRQEVVVNPGESIIVLPEVASTPLKPNLIMTSYTEITTSDELQFTVAAVDADEHPNKNVFEILPSLKKLDRDGRHVRGTFENANRSLLVDGTLGYKNQRIIIGDLKQDVFLDGTDTLTGIPENNKGNTGVLYNLQLKVAPHTQVGLNARGGHYAGAALVNDKVVQVFEKTILKDPNDVGVLYQTGDNEEVVNLTLLIASGSNLPLNILFQPINGESK